MANKVVCVLSPHWSRFDAQRDLLAWQRKQKNKKRKKRKKMTEANWSFAQTTHPRYRMDRSQSLHGGWPPVCSSTLWSFINIGSVVLPLWVVENRHFPLLWPLAYTTACIVPYKPWQWITNRDLHTPHLRVSFRMTLSDLKLSDLAKYSMTRSIAPSLCDSWASCRNRCSPPSRLRFSVVLVCQQIYTGSALFLSVSVCLSVCQHAKLK